MKHIGFISLSVLSLVALGCERIPLHIGDDLIHGGAGNGGAAAGGAPSGNTFSCGDGVMIDIKMACDGFKDCANGADEAKCSPSSFKCGDGKLIPADLRCNGSKECADGSDENNCAPSEFKCNDGKIIPANLVCNGSKECADGSDENNCLNRYKCNDGNVVQGSACDGIVQCADGSDESKAYCFECNNGTAIPVSLACNQKADCSDGSDEVNCPDPCVVAQESYSQFRTELVNKYGSLGCSNNTECTLLLEDNACGYSCNVPMPVSMTNNFLSNLNSSASGCTICPAPVRVTCEAKAAACVNGTCVAAEP
jgi:hypothetical protein